MIDLHTHTFFSDGALVPAEHLRRVEVLGYTAVAITDHADSSNMDFIIPRMIQAARDLNPFSRTRLLPGIELTHIPPALIGPLTRKARELGAQVVVVHGETIVEPVAEGTNMAAIEAGVDILSHPGFLSEAEALLAAKNGVFLELSGRKGHCLTNGHVAKVALKAGARLVVNADAHTPGDFLTADMARMVALGAGLSEAEYIKLQANMNAFVDGLPEIK
ncbi:MAG: histidinol phosphate phosphatase domain-containing protein [Proteobacteria bacterium]|jgi:histidinol phosphatase-like PHP family hydrolase|nr:histidinol phosphate phosphatase domain-containing protein [Desulfocapsa sp.]MBU3946260.1 histidinol phosphate phosphatase domain-containing protein [Pseudomonadota bacterium]MCG2742472.1 histidinol phosphate phosphatase domain-containing protein [Desulfobacteraceae bacterium]MBU4044415.1 histidinol phosphate phosphatase domain-containing protein [Pseudomonadota bacterium]MBU4084497.1 histidinol phosphate phosphatase domain-containing protein [Pseudomonadota bacterium]